MGPCTRAATRMEQEISTVSRLKTVSPFADTWRLNTCMALAPSLRGFVQHNAEQALRVDGAHQILNGRLRRHAGANDEDDAVGKRLEQSHIDDWKRRGGVDDDSVELRPQVIDRSPHHR